MVFRFEAMFISQIPDHEQAQTQREPRHELHREKLKRVSSSRSEAPVEPHEDSDPDRGLYESARYENLQGDTKYSG
jgi:hypothetical protein